MGRVDKHALRTLMNNLTGSIHDRVMRSIELWNALAELPQYQEAQRVMAFAAMSTEPDTDGLFARLAAEGRTLLLPRVEPNGMVAVEAGGGFRRGPFGIREPVGDAADPASIDLVVVPGLAFTNDGCRLGRGKAYYDTFLAGLPAATVGVCFTEQIVDVLPMEPHDVRLGTVVSA